MISIDLSSVATRLVSDIKDIIKSEITIICLETLQNYIQLGVYNDTPVFYERTMDFINAVDIKDLSIGGSSASFNLTVDPSKMGLKYGRDNYWGAHVINRNQDFRQKLIGVLESGGGAYRTFGGHPAGNFFKNTYRELDENLINVLAGALSARGWEVSTWWGWYVDR